MQEKITVEIFRDVYANAEIDTEIAYAGIKKIVDTINESPFEIVNDRRKLRATHPNSSHISLSKVKWPPLDATISILLTDKNIHSDSTPEESVAYGISGTTHHPIFGGLSIVQSTRPEPALTSAHENAHLMRLKYSHNGNTHSHCPDPNCLMYKEARFKPIKEKIQKRGLKAGLELFGIRQPEYQEVLKNVTQDFCSPCAEKLARQAFFGLKYISGNTEFARFI